LWNARVFVPQAAAAHPDYHRYPSLFCCSLLLYGYGYSYAQISAHEQQLERQGMWQPTAEQIAKQNAVYRGGWLTQMSERLPETGRMKTIYFLAFSFWREAGLMLIGIALFKLGVFGAKSPTGSTAP